MRFDPGFDTSRVLKGDVSLPALKYSTPSSINAFVDAVRERLGSVPGMALGGTAHDVIRLILGSAWRMIAPGLVLGMLGAWLGTRALKGILFGTSPTDPAVFAATVVTLALVASLASYLPARRAARVDPIVVLRNQ